MEFLEYSNKNHCNIIPKEEFDLLVNRVFGIISENITKSLGPLGSSATIINGTITEATKDGHQILINYKFRNTYMQMIYNLIKQPCTKMNNTVGDGTTTAIALANALFQRYEAEKSILDRLYRLPRHFVAAWDSVIKEICEKVRERSVAIDPKNYDTIYNIAYVVSNGSKEISEEIARTYKESESPSIKQKDSPTNRSYISPVNGFEFPANFIDEIYIKNQDGSREEKDIYVMVFDHNITSSIFENVIVKINNVMRAKGSKLLIIAPNYDHLMLSTTVDQYIHIEFQKNGDVNLILTNYRNDKLENAKQLSDLAVILRCKIITEEFLGNLMEALSNQSEDSVIENILENEESNLYRLIGYASNALMTFKTGTIFQVKDIENDKKYQDTLRDAKLDLETSMNAANAEAQSYNAKIYEAKLRIAQLEMKNYIYYIGADSALQKQITWASVEDVIKCVRSAIKHGVVPGCQLSIISICSDMMREITGEVVTDEQGKQKYSKDITAEESLKAEIIYIISSACMDVYSLVLNGPNHDGFKKRMPRWWAELTPAEEKAMNDEIDQLTANTIANSVNMNKVFDLETLDYNEKIITSAETDTMVLTAASELVKILISGNQCVFSDASIDGSHEETREVYA